MDVKVEASGLQIGVDNSITEALYNGRWGVRLSFSSEFNNRYEVALNVDEALSLIDKIQKSLDAITEVKKKQQRV